MIDNQTLFGTVSSIPHISNKIEDISLSGIISAILTIDSGSVVSGKPVAATYAGPYNAPALFEPQEYGTKGYLMSDNFKVAAINYTEAPNEDGITVTIGG